MKKYKYILPILSSLLLGFSCTSDISSINPNIKNISNINTLKVSEKGANVKGKIKFNSFNLKQFKERKTFSDLKSLKIDVLTTNADDLFSSFNPLSPAVSLIINIDNNSEYLDFELKGLPPNSIPTEYYTVHVYAYDNLNATGNIINESGSPSVPNDYLHVDSSLNYSFYYNTTPSPSDSLLIDIRLQSFEEDPNKFNLYSTVATNEIKDLDMKLDNLGNGIIAWLETDTINDQICFKKVKEYIPDISNDCKTSLNNVSSLSLNLNNNGQGNLLFLRDGNVDGYRINNYTADSAFQNYANLGNMGESFSSYTNTTGNGLIVYSKNHPSGNKAIYSNKIQNYVPFNVNEATLFYYDNNIVKNPQVAINSHGDGMITWEESSNGSTDFSISSIKVQNYNPPVINGIGTVSLSSTVKTVSGSLTEFTKQFYRGSKIKIGSNEYLVDTVDSDTQLTLVNFPVSSYSGTYQGLGINRKTSFGYNGLSGNSTLSTSLIDSFIKPGLKLKIDQNNQKVTTYGNILTSQFNIIEPLNSNISNSFMYTKEAYSLNLPNSHFHRVPSIQLNETGDGVIVWKIYEPSTIPDRQDYIAYQRIKNSEIVSYTGNPYNNYSINQIDLTSFGFNDLFTEDLSPISIRLNSFGNGYFFFSAKQNTLNTGIYNAEISQYDLNTVSSTLLDDSINSKSSLNQSNAGLVIGLSNDKKSINAFHQVIYF